ncbi:MAG TPA: LamG domain-containing protein [Kofleriaceae bacterium]
MGRRIIVGLALLAGCSFDRSSGGGGDGDGAPLIDGGGDGDGDGSPDDPDGGPCTTGALDFTPEQWVEVADDSLDLTNGFAVEAWVRLRAVDHERHVVSRHDNAASEGYLFLIKDGRPEFRTYFADDSGPPSHCDCTYDDEEVVPDQWVHLAGSFADGTSTLFVNGELVATCDCVEECKGTCEGDVAGYGGPLAIGVEATRFDRSAVDGLIDDVHVLAAPLSASFDPLQAATCTDDTLLLFRFDPPVGQELASECGAAATGRLGSEAGADLNDPTAVDVACPGR